jgi:hypothetical protein
MHFSSVPCVQHAPPSSSSLISHPNNICWTVQIISQILHRRFVNRHVTSHRYLFISPSVRPSVRLSGPLTSWACWSKHFRPLIFRFSWNSIWTIGTFCFYLTTFKCTDFIAPNDRMIMNGEMGKMWKEVIVSWLNICGIIPERLRWITKPCQHNLLPGRDSNPGFSYTRFRTFHLYTRACYQ